MKIDIRPWFLLLAFGVAGCSSSITQDDACTHWAEANCKKNEECTPGSVANSYGDEGTCVARLKRDCLDQFAAPGTSLQPGWWDECATQQAAVACKSFMGQLPACSYKAGTLADGTSCYYDNQCQSGYCSYRDAMGGCGACAKGVAVGGACNDSYDCVGALVCSNSKCMSVYAAIGEACNTTDGPYCGNGQCTNDVCVAYSGACETAYDCPSLQDCIGGHCVMDGSTGPGQPCGAVADGQPWVDCRAGTCDPDTSVCIGFAADGAACDPDTNHNCLPGSTCENKVCTQPTAMSCK